MRTDYRKIRLFATVSSVHQSTPSYLDCLRSIVSRQKITRGIENTARLARCYGDPFNSFQIVHVGGTNGKGSVCHKLARGLEHSGGCESSALDRNKLVGKFTSPHCFSVRERITINGIPISEEDFVALVVEILSTAEKNKVEVSYFEVCTLVALLYFKSQDCEWAVMEVGMGGKYDATNVVPRPAASLITSVGWDHMQVLGSTLEEIAGEKAGIVKAGRPVIVGRSLLQLEHALSGITSRASKLYMAPQRYDLLPIDEEHQWMAATFIRDIAGYTVDSVQLKSRPMLRMDELDSGHVDCIRAALNRWRMSNSLPPLTADLKVRILCDVAHNLSAIENCCTELERLHPGRVRAFVSLSKDRSCAIFEPLVRYFDCDSSLQLQGLHYCPLPHARLKTEQEIKSEVTRHRLSPSVSRAIRDSLTQVLAIGAQNFFFSILNMAVEEKSLLFVCGSVFMFEPLLIQYCGLDIQPSDPINSNEKRSEDRTEQIENFRNFTS